MNDIFLMVRIGHWQVYRIDYTLQNMILNLPEICYQCISEFMGAVEFFLVFKTIHPNFFTMNPNCISCHAYLDIDKFGTMCHKIQIREFMKIVSRATYFACIDSVIKFHPIDIEKMLNHFKPSKIILNTSCCMPWTSKYKVSKPVELLQLGLGPFCPYISSLDIPEEPIANCQASFLSSLLRPAVSHVDFTFEASPDGLLEFMSNIPTSMVSVRLSVKLIDNGIDIKTKAWSLNNLSSLEFLYLSIKQETVRSAQSMNYAQFIADVTMNTFSSTLSTSCQISGAIVIQTSFDVQVIQLPNNCSSSSTTQARNFSYFTTNSIRLQQSERIRIAALLSNSISSNEKLQPPNTKVCFADATLSKSIAAAASRLRTFLNRNCESDSITELIHKIVPQDPLPMPIVYLPVHDLDTDERDILWAPVLLPFGSDSEEDETSPSCSRRDMVSATPHFSPSPAWFTTPLPSVSHAALGNSSASRFHAPPLHRPSIRSVAKTRSSIFSSSDLMNIVRQARSNQGCDLMQLARDLLSGLPHAEKIETCGQTQTVWRLTSPPVATPINRQSQTVHHAASNPCAPPAKRPRTITEEVLPKIAADRELKVFNLTPSLIHPFFKVLAKDLHALLLANLISGFDSRREYLEFPLTSTSFQPDPQLAALLKNFVEESSLSIGKDFLSCCKVKVGCPKFDNSSSHFSELVVDIRSIMMLLLLMPVDTLDAENSQSGESNW